MDPKIDLDHYFAAARKMLFLAAHTEGTAERLGYHEHANLVFKRTAEFQIELIQTIEHVLKQGLIRPALATLRTALNLTTRFSWLAENFDEHLDRFSKGQCPGVQKMMSAANLGWGDEYQKSYAPLSDFVHGSFTLSDFNKVQRDYRQGAPYSPLGDYFIVQSDEGTHVRIVEDVTIAELIAEHGGYITLKAFDIALTMLMRASGEYADAFNWWPGRTILEDYDALVSQYDDNTNFLWLSEKHRLAVCRVEGRYR
ncbi:hypothetical protein ACA087_02120 [Pseudomonas chlororaphis]|uniref:hypothetical protein n=1 Tax=Pseudomonas chlororaphis TaxID=587753 RepID=UPI00352AB826